MVLATTIGLIYLYDINNQIIELSRIIETSDQKEVKITSLQFYGKNHIIFAYKPQFIKIYNYNTPENSEFKDLMK